MLADGSKPRLPGKADLANKLWCCQDLLYSLRAFSPLEWVALAACLSSQFAMPWLWGSRRVRGLGWVVEQVPEERLSRQLETVARQ